MNNSDALLRSLRLRDGAIDFARLKSAGNTQQTKNCTKGWPCGNTCLSRTKKNCKKGLQGQSKELNDWLGKNGGAGSTGGTTTDSTKLFTAPDTFVPKTKAEYKAEAAKWVKDVLDGDPADVDSTDMQHVMAHQILGLNSADIQRIMRAKDFGPEQAVLEVANEVLGATASSKPPKKFTPEQRSEIIRRASGAATDNRFENKEADEINKLRTTFLEQVFDTLVAKRSEVGSRYKNLDRGY